MKLTFLPRSARLPKRGYRLVLAAALFVAVALVGLFSPASVAHAGGCQHYAVVNQQTGYYLDVVNETPIHGAPIDQWYQDGSSSEAWNLIQVPGTAETYYFQNVNGGKYLDVGGASTADGADVIQWYFNGNANQQWTFQFAPDGSYNIINVNSGLVLDISTSDVGAQVIQNPNNNWLSQEWHLECA